MSVAYAPKGLLGAFTPQANTTVEPELALMMPPGFSWLNARMTSDAPTIPARLLDYMTQFPGLLAQFANAPVDAIGIACTGASYLLGREREDALLADTAEKAGVPVFTAASACVDALNRLGARRVALVSPYNSALDVESAGYWTSRGFEIVAESSAWRGETTEFHPIYSLDRDAALNALRALEGAEDLDAVLMLGTGMPTLDAIAAQPFVGRAPVLSCMLAMGWKYLSLRDPALDCAEGVLAQVRGGAWAEALARLRQAA